jgi:hypothetical protein
MATPTPPPTPPSSSDKTNFIARADDFVAWMTTFYDELVGGVYAAYMAAAALLGVSNKWTAPQSFEFTKYDFSSSMKFDFGAANGMRTEVSTGAWNIVNPYRDNIRVRITTVEDSTVYATVINGTTFDITSGASATAESIAAALVADINAGAEPVTATDNEDGSYDLDADVAGTSFSMYTTDQNQSDSVQGTPFTMYFDGTASDTDPVVTGDMFDFGSQGAPADVTGIPWYIVGVVNSFSENGIIARYIKGTV